MALLLRSGNGNSLATFGTATTQHFTATAGFFASAEPVGALATLIVWLVCMFAHGQAPAFFELGSIQDRQLECQGK